MNPRKIVRLSNILGLVSIILLVYWVFIFISTQVFGLKVFRENISELFFMSVLGILALMFGALILNIMFNLTRIAQKHNQDTEEDVTVFKKRSGWLLVLSFPLLFGLLYMGDLYTRKKKEQLLISSASAIVSENTTKAKQIADYSFSKNWIKVTKNLLYTFSNTDLNCPHVVVIVRDTIEASRVFLSFGAGYTPPDDDTTTPLKKAYLMPLPKEDRTYLDRLFDQTSKEIRFTAHNGNYELFYPYTQNGKTVVFYFSDYQRYGKG